MSLEGGKLDEPPAHGGKEHLPGSDGKLWFPPACVIGPRWFLLLSATLLAGCAALFIDIPVSRLLVQDKKLRALHDFLGDIEPFGRWAAIVFFAIAMFLCNPRRRVLVPRLLACSLGSGLAANLVKLLVLRARPKHHDLTESIWSSFQGLFPGTGGGSPLQSCPSAHTATAVGFALALSALYPAGARLFYTAAALVALQRIETGAHFVSDALWGTAVAVAMGGLVFRPDRLGSWFNRKERERWRRCPSGDEVAH
ncbi:MAG: phosphatase PAP2 family protein [Planctomycetales bacterium]